MEIIRNKTPTLCLPRAEKIAKKFDVFANKKISILKIITSIKGVFFIVFCVIKKGNWLRIIINTEPVIMLIRI